MLASPTLILLQSWAVLRAAWVPSCEKFLRVAVALIAIASYNGIANMAIQGINFVRSCPIASYL